MAISNVEDRLAALEAEVSRLKNLLGDKDLPWWKKWAGAFLNDPYFEKAMKYGRQYRESLRPKKKNQKRKNGTS